ncbi:methyltransferase domain-containing protein [Salinactinospora qingdaonensis]|uniref:Protein-L-isoaspartate O-methyltransferase n=1 Tax=Salinactinospora qingdaonensis TaxID=702744 RepID=A0ABP7FBB4_9ACTN
MVEAHLVDDDRSQRLRQQLVRHLVDIGALASPEWQRAFTEVARHVFVPRVFVPSADNNGTYTPLDGTDPHQRHAWLEHVYTDDICITQLDGDDTAWQTALRQGSVTAAKMTCTSSQPALMASMLELLAPSDGSRMLEIGTGTGYNAALLAHRLGSAAVASLDIDPGLVESARTNLTQAGYAPNLTSGDGAHGWPDCGPYTHLMATASFPAIPPAWLEQVSHGGTILANLYRPLGGGILVRLTVDAAKGEASGHFTTDTAGFMPTRTHESATAFALYSTITEEQEQAAPAKHSPLDLTTILDDPNARFFLALLSDLHTIRVRYPHHPEEHWLLTQDGSWAFATADSDGVTVRQDGPRRLWDEAQTRYQQWLDLGEPPRHHLGLTVTPEEQYVWYSSPDNSKRYPLSPPP